MPLDAERIEIPLGRRKLVLLVLGSFAFVALDVVLWGWAEGRSVVDGVKLRGAAVLGAGFFGVCGLYGCVKLSDAAPGLVLDREGILDNSSAIAVGRIPWADVIGVRVTAQSGQRLLTVDVADPSQYVARGGRLCRLMSAANVRLTGSPINISANSLAVPFDELERRVVEAFERHGGGGSVTPSLAG